MNNLISVNKTLIGSEELNAVNSRNVYNYLGLAKGQYSRWIKSNITKYGFIENEDFKRVDMDVEGQKIETFIVTTDMAKELAMISNTAKGREVRKYFISIEKEYQKQLISKKDEEIAKIKATQKLCLLTPDGFTSCRGLAQRTAFSEKEIRDFAEKTGLIKSKIKSTLFWEVSSDDLIVQAGPNGTPYYNLEAMEDVMNQYNTYE